MIESFDYSTIADSGWGQAVTYQAANVALNTSIQNYGTSCVTWDKSGTAGLTSYIARRLSVPWSWDYFRTRGYGFSFDVYHADWVNIDTVGLRFIYKWHEASGAIGADAIYEYWTFDSTGFSAGWNTIDMSDAVSGPTEFGTCDGNRHKVVGILISFSTTNAADEPTGFGVNALHLTGSTYAALFFNNQWLPLPPFDIWNRGREFKGWRNFTPTNVETIPGPQFETIEFGYKQARTVHHQDANLHTVEDSLRAFGLYTQENDGWAVAFPGHEIANGVLDADRLESSTSYSWYCDQQFVDDYTWLCGGTVPALGDAYGAHKAVRVGPNPQGQVSRSLLIGQPTSRHCTRAVRCPHDHYLGEPIRSMGYYPSLARLSNQPALRETGSAVEFRMKARAIA